MIGYRRIMSLAAITIALGAHLLGCSAEPGVATADASSVPAEASADGAPSTVPLDAGASTLKLAVGLGEPGAFVPPLPAEPFALQRGCQGAQHVFTSLRIRGAKGKLARVEVRVHRADDEALVSVPMDVRLPLEPDAWSDTAARITGLTPVIETPSEVLGREVVIRVALTDESGARAEGSIRGTVAWGTDSCGRH